MKSKRDRDREREREGERERERERERKESGGRQGLQITLKCKYKNDILDRI